MVADCGWGGELVFFVIVHEVYVESRERGGIWHG
jgi:hypothetical protein